MEDNTIYLLCLTNGGCLYEEKREGFKPVYANVPERIQRVSLVTYAPHGCCNMESTMTSRMKKDHFLLNQDDYNTKMDKELVEYLQGNDDINNCNIMSKETPSIDKPDTYIFQKSTQHVYSHIGFDRENNAPLPFKRWRIDTNTSIFDYFFEDNLYVIAESRDKKLTQALTIGQPLLNKDHPETNTNDLLQMLSEFGYTTVVIIDYSCDVCITRNKDKVPRDVIIDERNRRGPKGGYRKKSKRKNKKKATKTPTRKKRTNRLYKTRKQYK